jgi:hypothetical protein
MLMLQAPPMNRGKDTGLTEGHLLGSRAQSNLQ